MDLLERLYCSRPKKSGTRSRRLTSVGMSDVSVFLYDSSGGFIEQDIVLVWNLIGGIGFTLCGALGYAAEASSGAAYQSTLSTFWGGWAFLIGSVIQWYESVNSI